MTDSPPNNSVEQIVVLEVTTAANDEGMATLVLGEQLCCAGCGRISTRWQIPGPAAVPRPRKPGARHEPGE